MTGKPGDTYTVNLTANDVTSGKTVTLARSFRVVEPAIEVVSTDESLIWPKFLGQYRDITGRATNCPDGLCNDYSKDVLQANTSSAVNVEAKFIPSFLADTAEREWYIDNVLISETAPNKNTFDTLAIPGQVMNLEIVARVMQRDDLRRALYDIWGVSPLQSPEIVFSKTVQVEMVSVDTLAKKTGPLKYLQLS